MSKILRILVLSPTPTWPLDYGNRKRIHSVCRALQDNGAEVDFVYYPSEHDWRHCLPHDALEQMRAQWNTVFIAPVSRALHNNSRGEDHSIDEWWDPAVGQFLDWLFTLRQYDAFIVNYTWLSRALIHAPRYTYKILDTHDRFAGRRELLASYGIAPEFFHTTDSEEAIAFDRADLVLAIKDQEAEIFRSITKTNVQTLLHVETALTRVSSEVQPASTPRSIRVGVIGANNNINVRNLEKFLSVSIPIFEKYMAPLKIVIAGSQCRSIRKDFPTSLVEVLGPVPDVDTFYQNVDIVIAPMEFSTGLKIKVAEALFRGAPLVAHAHAFEGYPAAHPDHTCKSFEDIAMALVRHAFAPEGLARLREASLVSSGNIQASFDGTIRQIMTKSASHVTSFLMFVPESFAQTSSYAHQGIKSTIRYLRYAGRLIFVLPADSAIPKDLVEQELAPFGVILRGYSDATRHELSRHGLSFCAALFWDVPSAEALKLVGNMPIWMRSDATDANGRQLNEDMLIRQLSGQRDLLILDGSEQRAARLSAATGGSRTLIPYFYEMPYVSARQQGIVILCRAEQMDAGLKTARLLSLELPESEEILLCHVGEPVGDAPLVAPERVRVKSADSIYKDFTQTPFGARLVLDMTDGDPRFSSIRECLKRFRVPELVFVSHPFQRVKRWDHPTSIFELVSAVRTTLSAGDARPRPHVNDEGWSQLWHRASWATNAARL